MTNSSGFDPSVLHNAPGPRGRMLAILGAALDAVRPDLAIKAQLRREGDLLAAGHGAEAWELDLAACRRIFVVGAGKAGAPMARAVEEVLGGRIVGGLVVVKEGHAGDEGMRGCEGVRVKEGEGERGGRVEVVEAGHPIPSPAALAAGARVLALAEEAREDDLVVVLLSGGGSALLDALPQGEDGITLADLQMLTAALLACGATIGEINCLRKHLSLLKGGQLARAVYPARLLTLVLSDVVGSPLDVIASGPTVPDPTTWADAWGIVQRYGLAARLPRSIARRLREGVAGMLQETPKPGDPLFAAAHTVIVGDNRVAALAAVRAAQRLGYNSLLLSTYVEGEAAQVARVVAALAREVVASRNPLAAPACLVLGGETTVTLTPPAGGNGRNGGDSSKVGEPGKDGGPGMAGDSGRDRGPGKGGRNQELALAAAVALAGVPRVTVGCLATDGSDGPTDSAGAIVDGGTVARGRALDREAADALLGHDAYFFLEATADLLRCGPTLTNVNDLIVLLIDGP